MSEKVCPGCGAVNFHAAYSGEVGARMSETGECFTCAFWELRCAAGEPLVIDNHVYTIGKEPKPGADRGMLGMSGRRFDIEFFDGRQYTTHNLWSGGEIPERYWARLPNTARFLSGSKHNLGGTICWNPASEKDPPYPEFKP